MSEPALCIISPVLYILLCCRLCIVNYNARLAQYLIQRIIITGCLIYAVIISIDTYYSLCCKYAVQRIRPICSIFVCAYLGISEPALIIIFFIFYICLGSRFIALNTYYRLACNLS